MEPTMQVWQMTVDMARMLAASVRAHRVVDAEMKQFPADDHHQQSEYPNTRCG
jgi:hypothetical protein